MLSKNPPPPYTHTHKPRLARARQGTTGIHKAKQRVEEAAEEFIDCNAFLLGDMTEIDHCSNNKNSSFPVPTISLRLTNHIR